ncbi:hypothetical protein FZC78_06005 [Rossellomorea vietnamensis]|uniref:Uncharacterized protein n=1 Tax=Rossellomorea vietnamensis TaxID=218284 RepID=A0A5D4NZP6_9BACI|nr:hypothetical protein [Rossellomorea vietnamensis]TYS19038.1 hypothetical protein FZC78_06005 [Rossellomorea vietnamensis]
MGAHQTISHLNYAGELLKSGGSNLRVIYLGIYFISVLATIMMYILGNNLTEPLLTESGLGGGNGNPGLFPFVVLSPFLLIFIYGSYWLFNKLIASVTTKSVKNLTIISCAVIGLILAVSIKKAAELRLLIVEQNPSFENVSQVDLINTYSNSIFFNFYTFVALLLIILAAAGIRALLVRR